MDDPVEPQAAQKRSEGQSAARTIQKGRHRTLLGFEKQPGRSRRAAEQPQDAAGTTESSQEVGGQPRRVPRSSLDDLEVPLGAEQVRRSSRGRELRKISRGNMDDPVEPWAAQKNSERQLAFGSTQKGCRQPFWASRGSQDDPVWDEKQLGRSRSAAGAEQGRRVSRSRELRNAPRSSQDDPEGPLGSPSGLRKATRTIQKGR